VGEVQTLLAKVPPVAAHVTVSVAPPVTLAVKACWPGPMVWAAGEILEITTVIGVAVHEVVATLPPVPVTVRVYVLTAVNGRVGYEPPLAAAAVMSELPEPVEPMTAVPPENVGARKIAELYGGVLELHTRLVANGVELMTVIVSGRLDMKPPDDAVICEVPKVTAEANPVFNPMVATGKFEDAQVTLVVMFCVLLSLYVPVAVNCCVLPLATDGLGGVTAMDCSVAAVIVKVVAGLTTVPCCAVICEVPTPTEVAIPVLAPIVATVVVADVHVTVVVTICVEPSL
jgi:hypothetical protein